MTRVPKSFRTTQQILADPNHILHSLYTQSRELIRIEQIVHQHTDQNTTVSSLKNNELTLTVASGAIATKVRYRQRNLISSLRRAGIDVTSLKIKVQPRSESPQLPPVERHLSRENAERLAQSAQYIEDEPLRKALIALSSHSD